MSLYQDWQLLAFIIPASAWFCVCSCREMQAQYQAKLRRRALRQLAQLPEKDTAELV